MKKLMSLFFALLFISSAGCNSNELNERDTSLNQTDTTNIMNTNETETLTTTAGEIDDKFGSIKYTCDLSAFPTDDICNWFGEIMLIEDGKLLVSPGLDEGKAEYGEVVWIVCEDAWAYGIGQVVTYTFRDVKAPDKEGNPLNIIALSVYME